MVGQFSTPITPPCGSLFHADSQCHGERSRRPQPEGPAACAPVPQADLGKAELNAIAPSFLQLLTRVPPTRFWSNVGRPVSWPRFVSISKRCASVCWTM